MSFFKSVLTGATAPSTQHVLFTASALALASLAGAPGAARAQGNASDIYKKMTAVYANAKSYQGTVIRQEKGMTPQGKPATQTTTIKINYKAPNKFLVANTTRSSSGAKTVVVHQSLVSDGKSMVMFTPDQKLFQRAPVPVENTLTRFFALLNPTIGFTLQPDSSFNSRPAYVLKPNIPPNLNAQQLEQAKKANILLLIDKKTFQFLKLTISSAKGSLVQSASGQTLNGAISDSVFIWTPPASYKEQVRPQQGAPGGGGPSIPGIH